MIEKGGTDNRELAFQKLSVTLILQLVYIPVFRALKVIVFVQELASIVAPEHNQVYTRIPASEEVNENLGVEVSVSVTAQAVKCGGSTSSMIVVVDQG